MPVEEQYEFEVKAKGRVVLPAGLRTVCGFEPGTRVTARPIGRGQAILETAEAVLERIRSYGPDRQTDGVEDLRQWRDAEARAGRPESSSEDPDETGAATLEALGIR